MPEMQPGDDGEPDQAGQAGEDIDN
jgi:hypothetical protein